MVDKRGVRYVRQLPVTIMLTTPPNAVAYNSNISFLLTVLWSQWWLCFRLQVTVPWLHVHSILGPATPRASFKDGRNTIDSSSHGTAAHIPLTKSVNKPPLLGRAVSPVGPAGRPRKATGQRARSRVCCREGGKSFSSTQRTAGSCVLTPSSPNIRVKIGFLECFSKTLEPRGQLSSEETRQTQLVGLLRMPALGSLVWRTRQQCCFWPGSLGANAQCA